MSKRIESFFGGRASHHFAFLLREKLGRHFSHQRVVFHVQDS